VFVTMCYTNSRVYVTLLYNECVVLSQTARQTKHQHLFYVHKISNHGENHNNRNNKNNNNHNLTVLER